MRTEDQVVELTEKLIVKESGFATVVYHNATLNEHMQEQLREEVGKLKEYQQECTELKERMQEKLKEDVGILSQCRERMEQLNKKVAEFNEHKGRMDMQQRRMFCLFLVFVVLFCPGNAVGRGVLIAFILCHNHFCGLAIDCQNYPTL